MERAAMLEILKGLQSGRHSIEEALSKLAALPFSEDLGYARLDHHRALRCGFGEVVFGEGKNREHLLGIVRAFRANDQAVLVTRCTTEQLDALLNAFPDVRLNRLGRTARIGFPGVPRTSKPVVIAVAGTSDLPVAEEARETLLHFGVESKMFSDIGVAGLHRLLERLPALHEAPVIIAIAGMEGALPSVIGGLVAVPVIAVPTSVGYGASFSGMTALLAMLNSCASGIAVMNVDNGFGAAALTLRILNVLCEK